MLIVSQGTKKEDGIGLAVSTIEALTMRSNTPFLIFTTHFLNIPKQRLVHETATLGFFRMAVFENNGDETISEHGDYGDMVLLYQVYSFVYS